MGISWWWQLEPVGQRAWDRLEIHAYKYALIILCFEVLTIKRERLERSWKNLTAVGKHALSPGTPMGKKLRTTLIWGFCLADMKCLKELSWKRQNPRPSKENPQVQELPCPAAGCIDCTTILDGHLTLSNSIKNRFPNPNPNPPPNDPVISLLGTHLKDIPSQVHSGTCDDARSSLFHGGGELEASWVTITGGWMVGSTVWWVLLWAAVQWLEAEDWIYT